MIKTLMTIGDSFPYCLTLVDIEDPRRPCIYANEKFQSNTGYSPEFAVGKNLAFLQGELTSSETVNFMKKSFIEGKAIIQDIVNYRADGTPFLNRLLLLPIKDKGKLIYVGFQNDITFKKGLKHDNESLKNVHEGEIRHVVNNSLAIIMGSYSALIRPGISQEKRNTIKKGLEDAFTRIIKYLLEIEEVSEFENFEVHAPLTEDFAKKA